MINLLAIRAFKPTRAYSSSLDSFNVMASVTEEVSRQLPTISRCLKNGVVLGNSNVKLKGGVLLINGSVFLWDVRNVRDLLGRLSESGEGVESKLRIFEVIKPIPEIVLIGTGTTVPPPKETDLIRKFFKRNGLQVELMGSRNACSTYNVLIEEGRNVALAVMPVDGWTSAREPNLPEEDEKE
ncbi:hypothetical protein MP638_004823 [Amoeboaphelidium occidentale]|nr:hypothetical protein MP638_004823 [Amoeboaphelidium occidentale]